MASSNVQSYPGPFTFDFQSLQAVLKDVVPGGTSGFCREKEGIGPVITEIGAGIPVHAVTLGVATDAHIRINTVTEQLAEVRGLLPLLIKAVEVLGETEAYLEDEREGQIGVIVEAVRRTARRKDPAVLASFEKTLLYFGQNAIRAAKTRRKNAEAAEAAAQAAAEAAAQAAAEAEAETETEAEAEETDAPPTP
jgi:hypothetical protein